MVQSVSPPWATGNSIEANYWY